MATNKTPAWVWIGCGCFAAILGLAVALGGLGFAGAKFFQGMVEDMADPVARTEAALDTLGAETLPEGWHTHAFFHIPFAMTLVILSDGEPPAAVEGDFGDKVESLEQLELRPDSIGDNVLIYADIRGRKPGEGPSIDMVISGERSGGAQVNLGTDFESSEALGDGKLEVGNQPITWAAHRGSMGLNRGRVEGLWVNLAVDCPDETFREAVWFQRTGGATTIAETATAEEAVAPAVASSMAAESTSDEATGDEATDFDPTGTPADPAAIERLFGFFNLCD